MKYSFYRQRKQTLPCEAPICLMLAINPLVRQKDLIILTCSWSCHDTPASRSRFWHSSNMEDLLKIIQDLAMLYNEAVKYPEWIRRRRNVCLVEKSAEFLTLHYLTYLPNSFYLTASCLVSVAGLFFLQRERRLVFRSLPASFKTQNICFAHRAEKGNLVVQTEAEQHDESQYRSSTVNSEFSFSCTRQTHKQCWDKEEPRRE